MPRQFLREFVTQMDLVAEHPEYDPSAEYAFEPNDLRREEHEVLHGGPGPAESGDDLVPQQDVW